MISILDSLKCQQLRVSKLSLSSEETRVLVRAMESRVEGVWLGIMGDVSLDITVLTQYSGQGACGEVNCYYATVDRYREDLGSWARGINWSVNWTDNWQARKLNCVRQSQQALQ